MNYTTTLYDVTDINNLITQDVAYVIGCVAFSCNYSDLIMSLYRSVLLPHDDDGVYLCEHPVLTVLSISPAYQQRLLSKWRWCLRPHIENTISPGLLSQYEFEAWYYLPNTIAVRPVGPRVEMGERHLDMMSRSISQSVANGDYVPERYRRMAGLS